MFDLDLVALTKHGYTIILGSSTERDAVWFWMLASLYATSLVYECRQLNGSIHAFGLLSTGQLVRVFGVALTRFLAGNRRACVRCISPRLRSSLSATFLWVLEASWIGSRSVLMLMFIFIFIFMRLHAFMAGWHPCCEFLVRLLELHAMLKFLFVTKVHVCVVKIKYAHVCISI